MDYVGPKTKKLTEIDDIPTEELGEVIRKALNDRKQLSEQLTVVQGRCTELLMENRALRAELKQWREETMEDVFSRR